MSGIVLSSRFSGQEPSLLIRPERAGAAPDVSLEFARKFFGDASNGKDGPVGKRADCLAEHVVANLCYHVHVFFFAVAAFDSA
jgi:hypothetical protein